MVLEQLAAPTTTVRVLEVITVPRMVHLKHMLPDMAAAVFT